MSAASKSLRKAVWTEHIGRPSLNARRTVMIRISLIKPNGSSTLIYSGVGSVNVPLTLDALRIAVPTAFSHIGHHLIEVISESGEMFMDIEPDASGQVIPYGRTEDIELGPEIGARFGICIRLAKGVEQNSMLPSKIEFKFRDRNGKPALDAGGNPIGNFTFNFNIRVSGTEAIFATNAGFDVPEMMCERGRQAVKTFQLKTILPPTNSVTYSTSMPSTNPNFTHTMPLGMSGTTTNRFVSPYGPIVNQMFYGVSNSPIDDHFFVTAEDISGNTHSIPFISYMSDTPVWGELLIAGYEVDPAGRDFGNETITLRNASSRLLSLNGCYVEDELLRHLGLPSDSPVRANLPRRHLAPGATLVVKPTFSLNNDYDGFTLHNRLGSLVSLAAYVRRLPGSMLPTQPMQSEIDQQTVTVTPTAEAVVRLNLEDGDVVIIDPLPDQLWAGHFPHPDTGPEGWFDNGQQVPNKFYLDGTGFDLPLPADPVYALIMTSPKTLLIGNRRRQFVVDRTSRNTSGLRSGPQELRFNRNDDKKAADLGRLQGRGGFRVIVTVLRH
jgi:hypothetical protein